jgi:DnaJ-class molecular chaperone
MTIKVKKAVKTNEQSGCENCSGEMWARYRIYPCPHPAQVEFCQQCGGLGLVEDPTGRVHRLGSDEIKCSNCGGRGVIPLL